MSASPKRSEPSRPFRPVTTLSRIAPSRAAGRARRLVHAGACRRARRRALFRRALRLRPGRDFGRADGHQIDVRAEPVHRRGRDELGHAGRTFRRARRRRTRGQHRPQAHRADCRRVFHPGRRGSGFSPSDDGSCRGALIIGAGVGVAAVAAPLYAAELAPASWRGRFVSAYQLAMRLAFPRISRGRLVVRNANWRMMLGAAAVPGLLFSSSRWSRGVPVVDEDASSRGRGARNEKDRPCRRRRGNGS